MSTFLLTKKVCKSLTSPMAKFFWSSSLDKRSMHWVSWKELSTPKCKGGMGFRDPHLFNLAFLGKHGWRFLTNPNSLCARVLKGRYFPDTDFMHGAVPKSASATWKAIIAGREALRCGLISCVGDGSTLDVWTDKWIPDTISMSPIFRPQNTAIRRVADLIDKSNWSWKYEVVRETFIAPDAESILNIPVRQGGGDDCLAWAFERTGNYTMKSAYRALMTQNERLALEEGTATGTSNDDQ